MIYEDKIQQYGFVPMNHSIPSYFEVGTVPLLRQDTGLQTNSVAVVNKNTGDTISTATDSYSVIQDREIFEAFEVSLNDSGLDLTDMIVRRDRSYDGGRMFVDYVLPAHTIDINNAPVSLRFLAWNSHIPGTAANLRGGFFNWVCANGSVVGKELNAFRVIHKGEINVEVEIKRLLDGSRAAIGEMRRMKDWASIPVLDAKARQIFELLPASTPALQQELYYDWGMAQDDGGPNGGTNLWALYNVLTAWATHKMGKRVTSVRNQQLERSQRVAKVIDCQEWKVLERN